ncbi:hypothetical protein XENTR_v10015159 [Xenopus tropicalis]|uniref:Retinitis pigmentosa 1-like 1 protein n=2 Tax=Xenopus tropicalis TaxID=8364 RepID=A0A8J0SFA2_XENTR|nr:retinitis pigmentosa 1-like 1 protein [Xenopus tropicalis]KAE8605479.1 hypothetical protein XENTR_v10015159 [Xenopus tropicalis]KAE8605480.1 hypothetical protein XENTR_v10015159 [Xenopus tropicalis]
MNSPTGDHYMDTVSSPEQTLPMVPRGHQVTEVAPAKKITFYKSGDPQFGGVKMAISHRSFKSFSALMDDLSHRVPLPFGVRTITTPRGTHSVNRLEQLVDGGSYICSDKKYVQPIAPSKPGRKMVVQRPGPPASARKPSRQEQHEDEYTATHFQQVPRVRKKITLVKNGDPTVRRSIILNRTNGRNLRTFLEDASDLLQYTVRRLYTVDGRRIETIQALLQVPSILVCVGREPFKPIHLENVRKSVAEKLPGLRSHQAVTSETMDNKKNVNFGLKAKKSVIHPRTASSGKSRLSLSSEKSYPSALNMSPLNSGYASFSKPCPHTKSDDSSHSLVNEDIEKRVHVNKDGSLSVEMKVRFRLLNEETLQWSTQIKKSSNAGKNKCEQLCLCDEDETATKKDMNPELFSETDESFYPCDGESYSSKPNDEELEDVCCAHCGLQCQEYDIWKNPLHVNQQQDYTNRGSWQTRSSVSSSSSHKRVICNQKTSIDSLHRTSSEEYTERIVHRSAHYSETKEHGETRVTYSAVSQCTSCSGQSTAASNRDINTGEKQRKSRSSLKTENSWQNNTAMEDAKGSVNMKSQSASIEEWSELSPTPSSSHEINKDDCSQKVSVLSPSPVRYSRGSHRKVKKRVSAETISSQSNLSLRVGERQESPSMSAQKNLLGISNVNNDCEEMSLSSSPKQLLERNRSSNDEIDSGQENGPVRMGLSDCEKCSTKSSRHSITHEKRRVGKDPPSSSCSSINQQDNDSIHRHDNNIPNQCEMASELQGSCSSIRSETQQVNLQAQNSFHSVSSLTESTLSHNQEGQPITKSPVCSDNNAVCKPEDDKMSGPVEGRNTSQISKSRSSSISQSASSRHNCMSFPKTGKPCSASSRVSSVCDKESKNAESTDNNSTNDEESQVSQQNTKRSIQNGNVSNKGSDCEHNSAFSPSPPKGKPSQRQRRSSAFKYSCSSECSDPEKVINGVNPGCPGSTTSASKGILAGNGSRERQSSMKSNNSAEEMSNHKKRKDSSSSSKRKFKKESLDSDKISREIHPSALPNVTSEEVVHEWLRKIPSRTIVVDYEVEECPTKVGEETQTADPQPETDKPEEEGNTDKDAENEMPKSCQVQEETTDEENCTSDINNIPDTNTCNKEQKEDTLLSNRIEANDDNGTITAVPLCDEKIVPNTIHNSVQIMKALLRPLQESKFDRSNSLPEVSPSMGRKLSNSAKVLISCLVNLQLLDEGTTDCRVESNTSNKPKYTELLNILQDLWTKAPENKCLKKTKSGKHFSREDEVTPASSSGVDVNSAYDGSGDGSITGGGDSTGIAEKADESKLSITPSDLDNKTNDSQLTEITEATSGTLEVENEQCTQKDTPVLVGGPSACLDETDTHLVDENMNEKVIEDHKSDIVESEPTNYADNMNNVNEEITENIEHTEQRNNTMNIPSQTENSPESNESNTEETNGISSQSDVQSTIISTSDSNGKKDDKQLNEADPIWALKLLRKIENEFMTHYVDAMHEFKVRWNLEHDENLDEMISELKNDVGQRIQKSIANELKKIKSRAGQKMPRPPDDRSRRRSSLQADERRKRLQTMHKRSAMQLANGDKNKDLGTNDTSCETDEEDLTFSASFGNDANGLQDDDEFCPCETCIKKKKALKSAQPKVVVSDAPITRAFDLQQILKMKKENNLQPEEKAVSENACSTENENGLGEEESENGEEDSSSRLEEQESKLSLNPSNDENEADEINEGPSIVVENGECSDVPDADKDLDAETNNNESMENETEDAAMDKEETCSEIGHVSYKSMSRGSSAESRSNGVSQNEQQSDQENNNSDIKEDDIDTASAVEQEETKENIEDTGETEETEGSGLEESSGNEKHGDEDEIEVSSAEENGHQGNQENNLHLQKSRIAQVSLITHQGSVDDPDEAETAETSPNGDLDSPDSKKTQMYPDSSSEEDIASSGGASPVDGHKNGTVEEKHVKPQGSIGESPNNLEQTPREDNISEDEFDF